MSLDVAAAGGWGDGSLGDVTFSSGQINSYFNSTKHDELPDNQVWLDKDTQYYSIGSYHKLFNNSIVGTECLIVGFQTLTDSTNVSNLGNWTVAKISAATIESDHAIYTFDKSLADVKAWGVDVLFITIPHFKNFTIAAGKSLTTFAPTPNDDDNKRFVGGYIAFKCSDTFTLNGNIDLTNCGFASGTTTYYRPTTSQESHTSDSNLYAGCENSITKDHLLLNVGDGACWILAQKIVTSSTARIGNPSLSGVQYCRGATDSINKPDGVTNIGGSTIFIASRQWQGFKPDIIAKYRAGSTGRGLARAYLALRNAYNYADILPDEGLYALDVTHDPNRLKNACNISGFGNGSLGNRTYKTAEVGASNSIANTIFNAYAKVTAASGNTLTISILDTGYRTQLVDFSVGTLVMLHQARKATANDPNDGKFFLTRITAVSGSTVTLKNSFAIDLNTYYTQLIAIPEFNNFTLFKTNYNHTPQWSANGGGICAIACSGTCDLSTNGKITVEGRGTYQNIVNKTNGNYRLKTCLPIGQGHGSVFILANTLTMGTGTRIGATYDGSIFGGRAIQNQSGSTWNSSRTYTAQGGWKGADGNPPTNTDHLNEFGKGGHGAAGGINSSDVMNGGWFSNANQAQQSARTYDSVTYYWGAQGAHILIVANTINNFTLQAISTGGNCGGPNGSYTDVFYYLADVGGGAGYGGAGFSRLYGADDRWTYAGAGGYRGGGAGTHYYNTGVNYIGGGGSGAAFIYVNNVVNQASTGIVTI